MRTLIRIKFGSHLYGTATPTSDLDYKSVFIPDARDILLGTGRETISNQRPKAEGEKNFAGEVDEEAYSLRQYLKLVSEGQTVALDVLFAPSWDAIGDIEPEWKTLQQYRHLLVTRKSAAFLGYCRQQANKYGIKGSRVAAAKKAYDLLLNALKEHGTSSKLLECRDQIEAMAAVTEHMQVLDIEGATDVSGVKRSVRHWEVCNRKMPYTQTIKMSAEVMKRLVDEYGHRAKQAETNQGVDWKALSHAVRVGRQAIELLKTGEVTFPRPEAKHLVAIKTGQLEYKVVADEIEMLLSEVEKEAEKSTLRDVADQEWIDAFICACYSRRVTFYWNNGI